MGAFELLKKKIESNTGFSCESYREPMLKRRINARMSILGLKEYSDYLAFIKKDSNEYKKLLEALTINVTEFFRNSSAFDAFRDEVVPELLNDPDVQKRKRIRIWSAGCASGEESYSIAIILNEMLGTKISRDFSISILGTDIDDDALESAEKRIFSQKQVEKITPRLIRKYFTPSETPGKFKLNELDVKVEFKKHDLITGKPPPFFNAVFCRNLLIYLRKEVQSNVLKNLYDSLYPKGFMILGKTESLPDVFRDIFEVFSMDERIYRKN